MTILDRTTAQDASQSAEFDVLDRLVRTRRSNLQVDPDRPIPQEVVQRLLDLAIWAPNHKRTSPWRFAVVTGDGRARLGQVAADALQSKGLAEDDPRVRKTRTKYQRAPVVLVVGSAAHGNPVVQEENRDAVSAAIQNLLLGATALGLASYWTSGEPVSLPEVKAFAGLEPPDQIVGFVYLGWPVAPCTPWNRPEPQVQYLDK